MANREPHKPCDHFNEQVWSPTSESLLVWDEAFHDLLLHDRLRMTAYREAIFQTVNPGDHVVEIGVGTGILSQWALEAGAERVTGIEMSTDAMSKALDRLSRAGLSDRFDPRTGISVDVELDVQADVLISEIIGNMADNENLQPILYDAVRRFLKPGGRQVPRSVTSFLAPVSAISAHSDLRAGRVYSLTPDYKIQRADAASPFDLYYDCVLPDKLYLDDPQLLRAYRTPWDQPDIYDKPFRFLIRREGQLTGFKVCFIAELAPRTTLDICRGDVSSGGSSSSWKHAYLPIEIPISVIAGDEVDLTFSRYRPERPENIFKQVYRWRGSVSRGRVDLGRFEHATA